MPKSSTKPGKDHASMTWSFDMTWPPLQRSLTDAKALQEQPQRLVTVNEAAELMRVSPATVWRRIYDNKLLVVRTGRRVMIRVVDIDAFNAPTMHAEYVANKSAS